MDKKTEELLQLAADLQDDWDLRPAGEAIMAILRGEGYERKSVG